MKSTSKSRRLTRGRTYKTLWPRGRKVSKISSLAHRPKTLEGKTICELWDGLFRGDEAFLVLEEKLSERYPRVRFVSWTNFPRDGDHDFPNWKIHPNLMAEKGCDVAIVASGA